MNMNIFIFIPWFHPAYKAGGPIQSIANLVEQFDEVNYRIFCGNVDMDGTVLEVETDKWIRYNERTEVFYVSKKNKSVKVMKAQVMASSADLLFIYGIYDWYFNFFPMVFIKAKRKIISTRGMVHPNALAQKPFKKKVYLWFLKFLGVQEKCDFHATKIAELEHIEDAFGKNTKRGFIAPNYPGLLAKQVNLPKSIGNLNLATVALISPMKNHLLVLKALQGMEEKIVYDIYGPVKDEGYWKQCLAVIKNMPANIKVTYHEDIAPTEVVSKLAACHIFIMPSESENYGHSIVEALSAGRPVITSDNVPWRSLVEYDAGVNVDPHDVEELRKHISFFAGMDGEEMAVWSEAASSYIRDRQDVDEMKKVYRKMFGVQK